MQVVAERLPDSVAKISVTIDHDEVMRASDQAFQRVVMKYNVRGFRRGKVPRHIFERLVGVEVIFQAMTEDLVDRYYRPALQQSGVDPVADPKLQVESLGMGEGEPFSFVIEVEAKPAIEFGDYSDLLTEPLVVPEFSEQEMEEAMQAVARSVGQLVPADEEPVAYGNQIVLDLKGYLEDGDGNPQEEPFVEDEDYTVIVGDGTTVEGLDQKLVGLRLGEPTTVRLIYPESHPSVELAGKPVRFLVTVKENKRVDVPAIDEDLAGMLEYESLADLRRAVAERLAQSLEEQAKEERFRRILGKLKERVSFEVPKKLIETALRQRVQELAANFVSMNLSLEDYMDSAQRDQASLEAEIRPQAEELVREQLILEAIAKLEGLTVEDNEVMEFIQLMAARSRQPADQLLRAMQENGEIQQIRDNMLSGKVAAYLATRVVA